MKNVGYVSIMVFLFLSISLFSCSSNSNNRSANFEGMPNEEPDSISTKEQASEEGPSANELAEKEFRQFEDELQDSPNLPIDTMRITYKSTVDTLFGFRHGDTLTVEGDMKFNYRTATKRGVATTWNLWPVSANYIIVPYRISPNYRFQERINKAIQLWSSKVKIRFVTRTSEKDYIHFVPSDEFTRSYVGKAGKGQTIELESWADVGNIAHEIGHALGLYHEQSRSDREQYINVLCPNNINYRHAFKKDPYARDLGPYNFNSIMHYKVSGCLSAKRSGLPRGIPGQRDSITVGDLNSINSIYGIR